MVSNFSWSMSGFDTLEEALQRADEMTPSFDATYPVKEWNTTLNVYKGDFGWKAEYQATKKQ